MPNGLSDSQSVANVRPGVAPITRASQLHVFSARLDILRPSKLRSTSLELPLLLSFAGVPAKVDAS